jgi:hypothetical protein
MEGLTVKVSLRSAGGMWAVGVAMLLLAGCSGKPSRVHPDAIAGDAPQKAMKLYDTDHDGFIDGAELDKVPGLKAALKQVDTNGDGKISAEEIAARIKVWKDSKIGRTTLPVPVKHNGMPLVGAKVRLVPESFLGTGLQTGEGITNERGVAIVSAQRNAGDTPGLSPGFYRVEITKEGDTIPAKYNTATTLGLEVGAANHDTISAIHFDLQY